MKSSEELLRELANNPARLAEYAAQLQGQLAEKDQCLAQTRQELAQIQEELALKAQSLAQTREELAQTQEELSLKAQQLAEAQAIIADLKRELFGAKADKLNEEQEEQLRQLVGDVQEQSQRSAPLSQEVLEEVMAQ